MNIHSFIKGKNALSSINLKKGEKPTAACINRNQLG